MEDENRPQPEDRQPGGIIDQVRDAVNNRVENKNTIPNEKYGYISAASAYGFRFLHGEDGKLVMNNDGWWNSIDRRGDRFLRSVDDNVMQDPGAVRDRFPGFFKEHKFGQPKRYRGTSAEVLANVERLGLTDYYGPHRQGIEVKKPEIFTEGINLHDIYRTDSPALQEIDRHQALRTAGDYLNHIHQQFGAIGEVHTNDIIFQQKKGAKFLIQC